MRKVLIIINVVFLFWNCQGQKKTNKTDVVVEKQTIYQFKVQDLSGKQFDFATLKGKKIMIVNTASKCGLTPQYKELEAIYKEYSSKDFVIVGFPANNFAGQEPGTNEEIASFCQLNYGVTFPMMEKVSVKGEDIAPLFKFLTEKELNGVKNVDILWNFTKFLVSRDGTKITRYEPTVTPQELDAIIQKEL